MVPFNTEAVRADFPILSRHIHTLDGQDRPLVYLDHGASTHAPKPVIDAVTAVLSNTYANVHRGNHTLSLESTELFDAASETFLKFVGANARTHVAVLGQNTTMALDMAAHMVAHKPGRTLTTVLEHHSNELPHRRRAGPEGVLHADMDDDGRLIVESVEAQLERHDVKLLAVTGASNVTGHTPPLPKLARLAHDHGAEFLVDAAQLYAHRAIDVKPAGHPEAIDWLAAAGHKAYAPLGSAFLIGTRERMDAAPPYMPGGGTVEWVTESGVGFAPSPDRHMGGTPNIVGAVAFAAATRYLAKLGMANVEAHEVELTKHALKRFAALEEQHGVRLLGPKKAKEKVGVFSFTVPGVRHELVSSVLNHEFGIATRNGCFCAQPYLNRLLGLGRTPGWVQAKQGGQEPDYIPGATRATVGLYNTKQEIDALADALGVIASRSWHGKYEMTGHRTCMPLQETAAKLVKA